MSPDSWLSLGTFALGVLKQHKDLTPRHTRFKNDSALAYLCGRLLMLIDWRGGSYLWKVSMELAAKRLKQVSFSRVKLEMAT